MKNKFKFKLSYLENGKELKFVTVQIPEKTITNLSMVNVDKKNILKNVLDSLLDEFLKNYENLKLANYEKLKENRDEGNYDFEEDEEDEDDINIGCS